MYWTKREIKTTQKRRETHKCLEGMENQQRLLLETGVIPRDRREPGGRRACGPGQGSSACVCLSARPLVVMEPP